ncbi:unnamed protein product [Haemonchus placei]|uniref:Uncharacterized protein n=1 Tax=Haemonchus placei TaxID=6290 RepID=A0A0N4WYB4_HAEPC|nr:unnamed protein product [Haemonchus placei]
MLEISRFMQVSLERDDPLNCSSSREGLKKTLPALVEVGDQQDDR